jgi:hypothetical protein
LKQKKLTFAVLSLVLLAAVACGKKGPPVPKGLAVPRTIGDLRGDVRDGVLFLSFSLPTKNRDGTDVKDLEGFRIMKSCGPCGGGFDPWKDIRLTDRRGYTIRGGRLYVYDDDLRTDYVYSYRVYPYNVRGVQMDGSNVYFLKWQNPPSPPKGVTVREEDSKIVLAWEKMDKLLYNVYRWDGSIYPLVPLNQAPLSIGEFTDSTARNGKSYRYEVRAVRLEGTMAFEGEGTEVSATPRDRTPPAPPTALKLEKRSGGVLLSWAASPEGDLAGYYVYRIVAGKAERINKDLLREPRFFDEKPGAEMRYVSYYVTAVDTRGNESGPSREEIVILKEQ